MRVVRVLLSRGVGEASRRLPRRTTAILVMAAAALLVAPSARLARGGDPEIARLLLKGGKEDLADRRYDDALAKFDKARAEDDALIETLYWAGAALEGKRDPTAALARFREFRERVAAKAGEDAPPAEEQALLAKAQARIDALAPGEVEHRRLVEGYVARLVEFARGALARDPTLARSALDLALEAQPGQPEAQAMVQRLARAAAGEPPPEEPALPTDPFKAVKKWDDLITGQPLALHEGWKYSKGTITIDLPEGASGIGPPAKFTASRFVYEGEVRLLHDYSATWSTGLVFAHRASERHCLFLTRVSVGHYVTKGEGAPLEMKEMVDLAPIEANAWHRLGIVVDKDLMQGWFDGKKVVEIHPDGRPDWGGAIGIACSHAKVEYRGLRWSKQE